MSDPVIRAYVAHRIAGASAEDLHRDEHLSERIALVLRAQGFRVHVAWEKVPTAQAAPGGTPSVYGDERDALENSHLLVVLDTGPSTGLGTVIEIARQELIPIIFAHLKGAPSTRMIYGSGLAPWVIEFDTAEELGSKIDRLVGKVAPTLRVRAQWPPRQIPPQCSMRIEALRESVGMSRKTLSVQLGVPIEYIKEIEAGGLVPSLYVLRMLADAFGLTTPAPFVDAKFKPESKTEERSVIHNFFYNHNEGLADYYQFMEGYKNFWKSERPITEDDLCKLFRMIFDREPR